MTRVAILGGGISGCALAAELGRSGCIEVHLFERSSRLGGLHRSIRVGPYVFDIGAFVFDEDHAMFDVFPEIRELCPRVVNRYGTVREGRVLDDYPLSVRGIRRQYGTPFLVRTALETLWSKLRHVRRRSVRGFVEYYIGPTLYRESGLKRYIERLYLARDDEIDVEFAEKRLAAVAESAGIRQVLARLGRELLHGRRPREVLRPITADTVHVRPASGFEEIYDRIASRLRALGVRIHSRCSPSGIEREGARFRLRGQTDNAGFDRVFSTVPLEVMARMLGLTDFTPPEYMDLYSLFYEYSGDPPFPYNVLHNFTDRGQWKRLTMFSRYYGTRQGKHFFTVEGTGHLDEPERRACRTGVQDFECWNREERLLGDGLRFLDGTVTPRGYPVYRTSRARGIEDLKRRIGQTGVVLVGRQGSFNYVTSSDVAADAVAAARDFLHTPLQT